MGGRKGGKEGEGREGGKRIYDYGVRREKGREREGGEGGRSVREGRQQLGVEGCTRSRDIVYIWPLTVALALAFACF